MEDSQEVGNIVVHVWYLRTLKDATHISIFIGLCVDYANFPASFPNPHKSGIWTKSDPVDMNQRTSLN